jgi:hypothetical protein
VVEGHSSSGFGGLVPKFEGTNPAEAGGFFGRKNPHHAFLRREVKSSAALHHVRVKEPHNYRGSRNFKQNLIGYFSIIVPPLANRGFSRRLM